MSAKLSLLLLAALLALGRPADANLGEKLLVRRQVEKERESSSDSSAKPPDRLYPDLTQPPSQSSGHHFGHAPTPFVPFGLPPPSSVGSRLASQTSDPFRPMQQMRPMSPAERLQSQSFTSGLGRRLLSMIGIEDANSTSANTNGDAQPSAGQPAGPQQVGSIQEAMRALQNSTVLQQLNNGVQSIYGNLGKMYNSTVQQQLELLRERFQRETANSTNPWQQRMAQQIPMYFKSMSAKVEQAQEGLNGLWQQVSQANNGSLGQVWQNGQRQPSSRGLFGSLDQPMGPNGLHDDHFQLPGNFFNQIGRSFGFGAGQPDGQMGPNGVGQERPVDLGSQLMSFWQNRVQPQMNLLRGQMMRTWRELTSSGAFAPEMMFRSRTSGSRLGGASGENSSEVVDSILSSVDLSGAEYSLLEPTGDQQANGSSVKPASPNVANQIQSRLTSAQREVNQLWMGLSGALQNALANVEQSLNPRSRLRPTDAGGREEDPAANEIETKVKELSSLQREADVVHEVVRQQQQQQQQQQARQSISDRFTGFFNSPELEQWQSRMSDSVSRLGTVVGDFWGQIPERWEGLVQSFRPGEQTSAGARPTAPGGSSSGQQAAGQ